MTITTLDPIFVYNGMSISTLSVKRIHEDARVHGLRYVLIAHMDDLIEVRLAKVYNNGVVHSKSDIHAQYILKKIKDIFGEIYHL